MSTALRCIFLILSPFIAVYTFLIFLRNKFYDWKWFKSCSVPATVISVGNLQIGGTGKTPMVEFLATYLSERKKQIVILSRGYRRSSRDTVLVDSENSINVNPDLIGDEPFQLLQNLPGVKLAIDAERCKSAKIALEKWPGSVLLLDDGFQHRKISRDLNIVMLDPSRWSGGPLLFPLSDFRDVKSSLSRADLLVISQQANDPEFNQSFQKELDKRVNIPVFSSAIIPREICPLNTEERLSLTDLEGLKVATFCGIANPQRFTNMIRQLGGEICFQKFFRDHFRYRLSDLLEIEKNARESEANLLLTTQKDAVKLVSYLEQLNFPLYYLRIEMEIQPQQEFFKLVNSVLSAESRKI